MVEMVVWIPGISKNERDCYLWVSLQSQTTGPQTTNLPLVDMTRCEGKKERKPILGHLKFPHIMGRGLERFFQVSIRSWMTSKQKHGKKMKSQLGVFDKNFPKKA